MTVKQCMISLKTIPSSSKHDYYNDQSFRELFGTLKVDPRLPFSYSEFSQQSIRYNKGMSISGVQIKASIRIDENYELKIVSKGGDYILKPSPAEYPFAAENEHAAMLISRLLGIETALCGLVTFSDGERAYITKRFDRMSDGVKLQQEDMAQLFGIARNDKYEKSYEQVGRLLSTVCGGKGSVLLDFMCRLVYSYLIGNDDLHLKNISVQRLIDNDRITYDKLTPNYDCLFVQSFENSNGTHFMALDFFEEGFSQSYELYGFFTGNDFIALANKIGLPEKPLRRFIATIGSKMPKILALIQSSFMPNEMKQAALKTVVQRYKAISIIDD